jgi:hypothetical protein
MAHTSYLRSVMYLIYSSLFMNHSFVFSQLGSDFGRDSRIRTTFVFFMIQSHLSGPPRFE